jgi:hypothetical protein
MNAASQRSPKCARPKFVYVVTAFVIVLLSHHALGDDPSEYIRFYNKTHGDPLSNSYVSYRWAHNNHPTKTIVINCESSNLEKPSIQPTKSSVIVPPQQDRMLGINYGGNPIVRVVSISFSQ